MNEGSGLLLMTLSSDSSFVINRQFIFRKGKKVPNQIIEVMTNKTKFNIFFIRPRFALLLLIRTLIIKQTKTFILLFLEPPVIDKRIKIVNVPEDASATIECK